ncbi:MAG: helix-turn-helix domain-containing protein [Gemmatimonadaceae bacterium]|nr:helix-turn-helix domain-containing protein [Gemmatimonadaceae bacterium]
MPTHALYREWPAPPPLAERVACVWEARPGSAGGIVPPDNCADVLVHLDADDTITAVRAVGVMSRPLAVPRAAHRVLGIRFRPGWWRATLGISAGDLRDDAADLAQVQRALARSLTSVERAPRDAAWLLSCIAQWPVEPPPAIIRTTLAAIDAAHGAAPIDALAREAGCTRQHLGRCFDEWIGVSPKLASRVVRLEHALRTPPRFGWSDVAARYGYADQSHLIREARALRGTTPGEHA